MEVEALTNVAIASVTLAVRNATSCLPALLALEEVSIFLTFSLSGLIVWAATTAAPGSYFVWWGVVVQLMHFCLQIGRDSDRSYLHVKERIQILSRPRRWIEWAAATAAAREIRVNWLCSGCTTCAFKSRVFYRRARF